MSNAPFSGTTYHAYKYRKVMFQRANGIVPIVIKKEVKLKRNNYCAIINKAIIQYA